MKKILLLSLTLLLFSCVQSKRSKNASTERANSSNDLLENVRLAINPKFEDWVLFKNGTYVIFDNADTISDIRVEAIKQMKEYGPVFAGGPAGDINVISLTKTAGWVVGGYGYRMYTYVNPSELNTKTPTDVEVGLYGRSKRDKDGHNPEIIYVNRGK